jgi:uncharacterized protein YecT (DUF1311 family)
MVDTHHLSIVPLATFVRVPERYVPLTIKELVASQLCRCHAILGPGGLMEGGRERAEGLVGAVRLTLEQGSLPRPARSAIGQRSAWLQIGGRGDPQLSCLVIVCILLQDVQAAPCDDIAMTINTCLGGEGEVTADQLACLRSIAADAEREMNGAYQARVQATPASARRELASVQKLWAQSTQANCKFFANNADSFPRYECIVGAMIERKQVPEATDEGDQPGFPESCRERPEDWLAELEDQDRACRAGGRTTAQQPQLLAAVRSRR